MCANSEGIGLLCDKYHNLMSWLICTSAVYTLQGLGAISSVRTGRDMKVSVVPISSAMTNDKQGPNTAVWGLDLQGLSVDGPESAAGSAMGP